MSVLIFGCCGLVLGVVLLLLLRPMAGYLGLVDQPGGRKAHGEAVPLVGGVAIFFALSACMVLMPTVPEEHSWFVLSGAVLVAMGLLDDRYQLRASIRLVGQFLVSLMMIFGAGLVIRSIGAPFFFGNIGTGALAIPFTVLVSVTVINAINMTDGMDGLAGGISVIALAPFLVLLLFAGRTLEAGLLAALLGAVIAFLLFNFPFGWNRSMRTFLGDAGSTFLGMVVVWVGISVTQGPDRLLSPVAALWFVASPVHDLLASTIRRARKRKPFWSPDLGHAHHILLKAGFTPRQTLLTILAVAALFCVIGLSGPLLGVSDGVLFTLWALAGIGHILVVQRAYLFSKILGILRAEL